MSRLESSLRGARAAGRKLLVPFLTGSYQPGANILGKDDDRLFVEPAVFSGVLQVACQFEVKALSRRIVRWHHVRLDAHQIPCARVIP